MIGQGVSLKASAPPPAAAAPLDHPCISTSSSEVLAFCSSFINTATTSAPAPPAPSEPRRLAKAPHPTHILKCPRCASLDTKFCYYNNYSLSQPRYFCKNCKRYWTAGGVLRNVPVGGGLRKNKRSKLKLAAEAEAAAEAARVMSSAQQHNYEVKQLSPVQQQNYDGKQLSHVQVASACARRSSAASGNCSAVPGVPVENHVEVAPPDYLPSHDPTATHLLPRTSSGSECSTVESAGNESCTASAGSAGAFLLEPHGDLQRFYGGTGVVQAVGRPQFYASYASMEQVARSNPDRLSASFSAMVGKGSEGVSDKLPASIKDSYHPSYEWHFLSENLFSGSGTEGFLPLPGGSWPDFSQFHDPAPGPG